MRIKYSLIFITAALLAACGGRTTQNLQNLLGMETENIPEVHVVQKMKVTPDWKTRVGDGTAKRYKELNPVLVSNTIFTASQNGRVSATNLKGKSLWTTTVRGKLSSGPAVNEHSVIVTTDNMKVVSLNKTNGKINWTKQLNDNITAVPGIVNGHIIISSATGELTLLNETNGQVKWTYHHNIPQFNLAGGSTPISVGDKIVAGFADGKVVALSTQDGQVAWERTIAYRGGSDALTRMVDITANPIAIDGTVYVATNHGHMAALEANTGEMLWSKPISVFANIAQEADILYASDDQGYVWAFDALSGQVLWQQKALKVHRLTAPTVVGQHLVVGDNLGDLFFLSKEDGALEAKVHISKAQITSPSVAHENAIYTLSSDGSLSAHHI